MKGGTAGGVVESAGSGGEPAGSDSLRAFGEVLKAFREAVRAEDLARIAALLAWNALALLAARRVFEWKPRT